MTKILLPGENFAAAAFAAALARRAEGATRLRALADDAALNGEYALSSLFRGLAEAEHRHLEKLGREIALIDGCESLMGGDLCAEVPTRDPEVVDEASRSEHDWSVQPIFLTVTRALECASSQERWMRESLERLAADSADGEVRLRALSLALAGSRHLDFIEAGLDSVRKSCCDAGDGHRSLQGGQHE